MALLAAALALSNDRGGPARCSPPSALAGAILVALETLWFLGSFAAFDHLSGPSALPVGRVAGILGRLARSLLR